MNERPNLKHDQKFKKSEFFDWVTGREGRYELQDGRIIVQAGGTRNHWRVTSAFLIALRGRLAADAWEVGTTDLAVEIGDNERYPDVLVEAAGGDGSALSTSQPVILIEVLSPSSVGLDMTIKLAEYTTLASLEAYIVASQEEPICWVWQRGSDGCFPRLPEQIEGRDASIGLHGRSIDFPLAEIYRGIGG